MLVKTGSQSGAMSSISSAIASKYLDKVFGSKIQWVKYPELKI